MQGLLDTEIEIIYNQQKPHRMGQWVYTAAILAPTSIPCN